MYYSIVLFGIFVLPIALKNYLKNKQFNLLSRWLTFFIPYLIFIYFFGEFRTQLWAFFRGGINGFMLMHGSKDISLFYKIVFWLYFLLCGYMSGLVINLGRKSDKSRKLLLKSIVFISGIMIMYYYCFFLSNYTDFNESKIRLILFLIGFFSITFGLLYIFYSSKKIVQLFKGINTTR